MNKRNEIIHFRVNDEEEKLIKKKFDNSGLGSYSHFLRKLILNGHVIHLDLKPIDEISSLLRICSNNINQIARRMNSYESISKEDIQCLRASHEKLNTMMKELARKIEFL